MSRILGSYQLLHGQSLTLTGIGRALKTKATTKSSIKRIDRLIGNKNLYEERLSYYKLMSSIVIGKKKKPVILVDASTVDNRSHFILFRAAIAYKGRSIVLYDQVLKKGKAGGSGKNLTIFLDTLEKIIPSNCKPVLVTDAAFQARWFTRIYKKGWYFVGRVRGNIGLYKSTPKNAAIVKDMKHLATRKAKSIGQYFLSKSSPVASTMYTYWGKTKGRKSKHRSGKLKRCHPGPYYSQMAKEPWFIASNLPADISPDKIILIYKSRMQIEENFRDFKDVRYGVGCRLILSRTKERVEILLLIGALAMLIQGIIGILGYNKGLHKAYQANTISHRRVLSYWYLGKEMIRRIKKKFYYPDLILALQDIQLNSFFVEKR